MQRELNNINLFVGLSMLLFIIVGASYEFDCGSPNPISVCNKIRGPMLPAAGMTPEYLDAKCTHLKEGNDCLLTHAKMCMKPDERKYTEVMLAGMVKLQENLCNSPTYRQGYATYFECRSKSVAECRAPMRPALEVERAPAGTYTQDEIIAITCKSYQDFMNCSEVVVERRCGAAATDFVKNYLRTLHGPYIKAYCTPSTTVQLESYLKTRRQRRRMVRRELLEDAGLLSSISRFALD